MTLNGHRFAATFFGAALLVTIVVLGLLAVSARLPNDASGKMLAVFPPTMSEEAIFTSIAASGGRPLRKTWLDFVWVISGEEPASAGRLRENGALGAYRELPFSPQLAGCVVFADAKVKQMFAIRP